MSRQKLPPEFYRREDVISIARELLGKHVFSTVDGQLTGGLIVETEAYTGPEDRGSHAYLGRRTPKNDMMYSAGGVAYMYICYGIHDMLNVVTGTEGSSHAILVRAIEPTTGIDIMRERRNIFNNDRRLCQGPGALARALGLAKLHNGVSLQSDLLWIEDSGIRVEEEDIIASARIGLSFQGPYRDVPWRFFLKGNKYVSRVGVRD